jgi:TolB protein
MLTKKTIFCDNCGSKVEAGTPFCPYCGFRLTEGSLPPPPPPKRRGGWLRRITTRLIGTGFVLLFLLLGIAGVGFVAVYHGIQDRELRTRQEAQGHYQKGMEHLQAGDCELAIAEFEFAIRLAPDYAEAYDKLYKAEAQCQALPTPTSEAQKSAKEIRYERAAALVAQGRWSDAIVELETLIQLDPTHQADTVQDMLFESLGKRALQLVNEEALEEALYYFDRALEMRDDADWQAQRRMAALYQTGLGYWEVDWQRAIDAFIDLYRLDPDYKNTEQRLHDAYVSYGERLAEEEQWCLAREQFAEAVAVIPRQSTEQKRVNAHTRCVTATPTPLPSPTTRPTPAVTSTLPEIGLPFGKLALSVYNSAAGSYDLYIAHAGAEHWTKVRANASQPSFHRDGARLAFRALGERPGLGVVNADGSNALTLDVPATAEQPTWSPDGTHIAFAAQTETDEWKIFSIAAGNGAPQEMTAGQFPAWGPNNWLAYNACDDPADANDDGDRLCGIHFRDLAGSDVIKLTADERDIGLAWAPDGTQVAYMSDHDGNWEIYLLDFPWGKVTRMTTHKADDGLPTWSPDGQYIAFLSNREGPWAVYVMSRDGETLEKVLDVALEHPNWLHDRLSWAP